MIKKIKGLKLKVKNTIRVVLSTLTFIFAFLLFTSSVSAQTATLSLSPSSGTYNRGCSFNVNVLLNTGSAQTDGTDAIIIYDNTKFTANSITKGTIYADYPGNSIDEQNGKVIISGLATVSTPFSGSGTFATINFSVKDSAPTTSGQIYFDFDSNNTAKTTDSNVVQRGTVTDILNSVTNGTYTVGTGSCGGSSGGSSGGTGTISQPSGTTPTSTLPASGTKELTFTIAIVGGILTVLGALGLMLL